MTATKLAARLILLLTATFAVSTSAAQDAPGEGGQEKQAALQRQAEEAADNGQLGQAVVLIQSALALGEYNVLYLSLGRYLFKSGRCEEALDAYASALTAPAVQSPSPEQVRGFVEEYRSEVARECKGTVVLNCSPPDLMVEVAGQPHRCGVGFELRPGKYTVTGTKEGRVVSMPLRVAAMQTVSVDLVLGAPTEVSTGDPPPGRVDPAQDDPTLRIVGWSLMGGGAFVAGTGALFGYLTEERNDRVREITNSKPVDVAEAESVADEARTFETIQFIGYGVGAAAVLGGLTLLLVDILSEGEEPADQTVTVFPVLAPDVGGVAVGAQF